MTDRLRGAEDYTTQIEILDEEDLWGKRSTIGMAELAVRLGSIVAFDRRGQVLWMDDARYGLRRWIPHLSGSDGSIEVSGERFLHTPYAFKLAASSDLGYQAYIVHHHSYFTSEKIGIEASFSPDADVTIMFVTLRMRNGARRYEMGVRIDLENENLDLFTDTPGWTTIDYSFKLFLEPELFHTFKVVCDPVNNKYVRLMIPGEEIDISAYTPFSTGDTSTPHMILQVMNTGTSGENAVLYVDDIILTVREPD